MHFVAKLAVYSQLVTQNLKKDRMLCLLRTVMNSIIIITVVAFPLRLLYSSHKFLSFLWSSCIADVDIIFLPCGFYLLLLHFFLA